MLITCSLGMQPSWTWCVLFSQLGVARSAGGILSWAWAPTENDRSDTEWLRCAIPSPPTFVCLRFGSLQACLHPTFALACLPLSCVSCPQVGVGSEQEAAAAGLPRLCDLVPPVGTRQPTAWQRRTLMRWLVGADAHIVVMLERSWVNGELLGDKKDCE